MKTAMQELIQLLKELQLDARNSNATEFQIAMTFAIGRAETKLEKEKEQMIDFYNWMRRNDSSEEYFHYSDEDMLEQYLTKTNNL